MNGELVASFRKGDLWNVGPPGRYKQLSVHIERHLRSWGLPDNVFQSTVKVMCGALLAISEDPHAGCLLCIYENDQNPAFEHMGEPWKTVDGTDPLNMTRDELTALMAMDGATCLSRDTKGKPTVQFRRLVSVSDEPARDFDNDVKDKLDGEGSRKWSAANAARRSEIAVVISVSQDGPMHIYAPDQETKKVTITTL